MTEERTNYPACRRVSRNVAKLTMWSGRVMPTVGSGLSFKAEHKSARTLRADFFEIDRYTDDGPGKNDGRNSVAHEFVDEILEIGRPSSPSTGLSKS
jgi:hypothetical protein